MIRVRTHEAVASIALDRADARNAMSTAAWEALADAARSVAEARVVILRSDVPGIFSAGADVHAFEQLRTDPGLRPRFRTAMRGAIEAIAALPIPVIAALDGGCFGAAVALALAADFRIAGDGADSPPRQRAWGSAIPSRTSRGCPRSWGGARLR